MLPLAAHQEAAEGQLLADRQHEVPRSRRRFGGVVLRDGAAHGHAAADVEHGQGRLEVVAADVVEVDVDPALAGGCLSWSRTGRRGS